MNSPIVDWLLIGILGILAFPSLSDFAVLTLCCSRRSKENTEPAQTANPHLLVLIPAHNEENLVGRTISSLLAAEYPAAARRIIVIADNCSDSTEKIARDLGVECLVRVEPDKPGKPQALAWATRQALAWEEFRWNAVVIVDADSVVDPEFLSAIGATPELDRIVCQARNGVENARETWLTVLGDLLVRARYDVLFKCKSQLGLNCPTAGNGTVVGRSLLQSGWQAFSLAEGWELYARATLDGQRSKYVERARIVSQEARSIAQSSTQRRRWSAGRWHVLTKFGWEIAKAKKVAPLQRLDSLCELSNPGPVTHVASLCLVYVLVAVTASRSSLVVGALIAFVGIAPYFVVYIVAILHHPDPWLVAKALTRLPGYALWRLPAGLLAMLVPRDSHWLRTKRH